MENDVLTVFIVESPMLSFKPPVSETNKYVQTYIDIYIYRMIYIYIYGDRYMEIDIWR